MAIKELISISSTQSNINGFINVQNGFNAISFTVSFISSSLIVDGYLFSEQSIECGQPDELYLFTNLYNSDWWSFTSSSDNITYDGKPYIASLIRRNNIKLDSNSLKTQLEIEVDLSNNFVRNFISDTVEGVIKLTIYRGHNNSNYITYWVGYVNGIKFKPNSAIILASLKISSLKRFGLMRKYQRNCGLPLYSTWCTIDKNNYKVDGVISIISGNTITADIFSSKDDGWFLGGKFETSNCLQKITYHVGNVIKLSRAVSVLSVGESFSAYAGCDHAKSTCKDKFSNKLNFGGHPYLPNKNPFYGDPIA
jgi:uncharacterized phage protein (TIGR02218 family)